MQNLVHINKVEYAPIDGVNSMALLSDDRCAVSQNVNFTDLNIKELAEVRQESEVENGEVVYNLTLSFNVCHDTVMPVRRLAFRLTGVDGRRYMFGTFTRPYPLIKSLLPIPGKPAESQLLQVTVTRKSTVKLLRIVE